ncbi:hypothetical protein D3C75_1072670 [compost metagenome]
MLLGILLLGQLFLQGLEERREGFLQLSNSLNGFQAGQFADSVILQTVTFLHGVHDLSDGHAESRYC